MTIEVVHTAATLHASAARRGGPRAVVMTMGALHDGHAELVRSARECVGAGGTVVVTVFVNPTQFGAGEDFDRYPRTLDADVRVCDAAGADIVFAPDAVEVYGPAQGFREDSITVDPGPLGDILEGAARPGHFRGTLTVVAKLLGMTHPQYALFGEKDYQQLTLVSRMVADLDLPTRIVPVPTVREPDGLARSSRNRFLSADERRIARAVPQSLEAAVAAASAGGSVADVRAASLDVLAAEPSLEVDYVAVTDALLGSAPEAGEARVLVAVRVGTTRLIDNCAIVLRAGR